MSYRVSNAHGVPLALAVWALHDEYDYVDDSSYISATTLMKPLRHILLPSRVPPDMRVQSDVIDYLARASGNAFHSAVENAWHRGYARSLRLLGYPESVIDRVKINPKDEDLTRDTIAVYMELREKRQIVVNGVTYTIGGKYDMVAEGIVHDVKSTSTYTWTKGSRVDEHRIQGSIYKWLNPGKITADVIRICYIFTDWQKAMARSNPDYPQQRMVSIDIPLMTPAETEQWIRNKISLIQQFGSQPEPLIPPCSDEDLWIAPPQFKYYSDATKTDGRSTKNFDSLVEANQFCATKGKGVVKTVLGTPKRCEFCSAYPICTQENKAKL